jgi:hypothetical protein
MPSKDTGEIATPLCHVVLINHVLRNVHVRLNGCYSSLNNLSGTWCLAIRGYGSGVHWQLAEKGSLWPDILNKYSLIALCLTYNLCSLGARLC